MADLLEDEDPSIRERVCMALTTIAETMDGKEAIVRNKRMMNNFIQLLDDPEDAVRVKVCACLEMISRTWVQADVLVEYRFIELVLERILGEEPAIIDAQLELLTNLMYCDGKDIALENNAFDIFVIFSFYFALTHIISYELILFRINLYYFVLTHIISY